MSDRERIIQRRRVGVGPINANVRLLCQGCNGEWMGALEDAALPFIVGMSRGEDLEFGLPQMESIASWALAATILRSHVDDASVRPVAPEVSAEFRRSGLASQRLVVLLVNIARDGRFSDTSSFQSQILHDVESSTEGLVGVYWFHQLLLVVALGDHARWIGRHFQVVRKAVVGYPSADRDAFVWPPANAVPESLVRELLGFDEATHRDFADTYTGPGVDVVVEVAHGDHYHREGIVMLPQGAPRPNDAHFATPQEFLDDMGGSSA